MKKLICLFLIIAAMYSCQKNQGVHDRKSPEITGEVQLNLQTGDGKEDTLNPLTGVNENKSSTDAQLQVETTEWVDARVEKESGDMYLYLEKSEEFFNAYPEKRNESFNMWELKYFLDIKADGQVYKGIEIFIDLNAPRYQYIARGVGDMCFAIKKGSQIGVVKQAWEEIISKKRQFLYPNEITVIQ